MDTLTTPNNITVAQIDSRPISDYLQATHSVNVTVCNHFHYQYIFTNLQKYDFLNNTDNLCIVRFFTLKDLLFKLPEDHILVYLDSDAWIQNGKWLGDIIEFLNQNKNKHGCFSRDPALKKNVYINAGGFIIKNNSFIRQMFKSISNEILHNIDKQRYRTNWPFDQFFISEFVYNNKEDFIIFAHDVLNTPIGSIIRHNWWKDDLLYKDTQSILTFYNTDNSFNILGSLDTKDYPNLENDPDPRFMC